MATRVVAWMGQDSFKTYQRFSGILSDHRMQKCEFTGINENHGESIILVGSRLEFT